MRILPLIWLFSLLFILISCQDSQKKIKKELDQLQAEETDRYSVVVAYATYLSTTHSIEAGDAIPMINKMISLGYPAEARYSINNLKRNGIHSYDLLALRGLCYSNELQDGLAVLDLEKAHAGDPGNAKIKSLLDQVKGNKGPGVPLEELLDRAGAMIAQKQYDASESALDVILKQDNVNHRALYFKGKIRLLREQYDSALYFITFARSSENLEEYSLYISRIGKVVEGEKLIVTDPGSISGYVQKSQGLASMGMFDIAKENLDMGLVNNPGNLNLILAKALVWVQADDAETAQQYLWEQEQSGIAIDPGIKQQILQKQN